MYPRPFLFSLAVLFILLLNSCQKDELTKPVEVQFDFIMSQEAESNTQYNFREGTFEIESISFSGDRERGEDISFTSDFSSLVEADLAKGIAVPQVTFNLPQGIYKTMGIWITTGSTIVISGAFENKVGPMPIIPIRLEMDIPELNFVIESKDGASKISLNKNTAATVKVYLNPGDWFKNTSLETFENAELQQIKGKLSIMISKNFNQDIYSSLTSVIPGSIKAVIE